MYVGDRDTSNDVFCQDCGRIADRETLDRDGFCEDCRPSGLVFHNIPNASVCGICGEITDASDLEKYEGRCEYCHTLNSLCEAVILVTRRELAGHITSDTAQEQIKALIETAAREL